MKEDFIQALVMTLNLLFYEEGEDDARKIIPESLEIKTKEREKDSRRPASIRQNCRYSVLYTLFLAFLKAPIICSHNSNKMLYIFLYM